MTNSRHLCQCFCPRPQQISLLDAPDSNESMFTVCLKVTFCVNYKGQSTYLNQNFLFVHDPDHFSDVGTLLL